MQRVEPISDESLAVANHRLIPQFHFHNLRIMRFTGSSLC